MDIEKTRTVNHVISDFEITYQEFLKAEKLHDCPVVRTGFYLMAEEIVDADPVPDEELQTEVLSYLETITVAALDDGMEQVELMFMDVSQRTKARRVLR